MFLGERASRAGEGALVEIKSAVDQFPHKELAELAAFIRERDNAAWDREIDEDFAETGRLRHMMEEVRGDARAGRLEKFRDRRRIRNFERAHSRLMILRINCPA